MYHGGMSTKSVPDIPHRPADAYQYVEQALPVHYLVANQPPVTGRKLIVSAYSDGVRTYWEMDRDTCKRTYANLKRQGAPVEVTTTDYDNRERR
jgi:hypothetical protein